MQANPSKLSVARGEYANAIIVDVLVRSGYSTWVTKIGLLQNRGLYFSRQGGRYCKLPQFNATNMEAPHSINIQQVKSISTTCAILDCVAD